MVVPSAASVAATHVKCCRRRARSPVHTTIPSRATVSRRKSVTPYSALISSPCSTPLAASWRGSHSAPQPVHLAGELAAHQLDHRTPRILPFEQDRVHLLRDRHGNAAC